MRNARFFVAASLALGWPALAQKTPTTKLDAAYHGIWAVNGSCDDATFVFASTFIERAGEDICYIDEVTPQNKGVSVTASCYHEGSSVGSETYNLFQKSGQTIAFLERPNEAIERCGPVPQDLIDAYSSNRKH